MRNCKTCHNPTEPQNIFSGDCVDCFSKYAEDDVDRLTNEDISVDCVVPIQDPLHKFGGFIMDEKDLIL